MHLKPECSTHLNRRTFLNGASVGVGTAALSTLLGRDAFSASEQPRYTIGGLADLPHHLATAKRVILTKAKINRAMEPEQLEPVARKITPNVTLITGVKQALEHAINTTSKNDIICVAGSLYVVGEAKEALEGSW